MLVSLDVLADMTRVDYLQAFIAECSTYEEQLGSQLTEVRHNAPGPRRHPGQQQYP